MPTATNNTRSTPTTYFMYFNGGAASLAPTYFPISDPVDTS
jgi:hypothetical protein